MRVAPLTNRMSCVYVVGAIVAWIATAIVNLLFVTHACDLARRRPGTTRERMFVSGRSYGHTGVSLGQRLGLTRANAKYTVPVFSEGSPEQGLSPVAGTALVAGGVGLSGDVFACAVAG